MFLNMSIIFLTSNLMEAARGQKHPSEANLFVNLSGEP